MTTQHVGEDVLSSVRPYLKPGAQLEVVDGIPASPAINRSPGLDANAYYFDQPQWVEGWLRHVHRYPQFRERWLAATGSWDGKVVVDIGCGPGNVFAEIGGSPELLIGIDVARGSLERAQQLGYAPLLADAQQLPLIDAFADIVAVNATLHHCDDMRQALAESARLVRPGGVLIIDHEPQLSAYDYGPVGRFIWRARMPLYRLMGRGGHRAENDEQAWAFATEIHHKPGDGVTRELYEDVLRPMGFDMELHPHNNRIGAEALSGDGGRSPSKIRMTQWLSGINPNRAEGALTLMCIARRR